MGNVTDSTRSLAYFEVILIGTIQNGSQIELGSDSNESNVTRPLKVVVFIRLCLSNCSVLKVTLTYSVFYFSCDSVTSISRFQIQQIDLQELDNLFISKHQT